jgi:hypothetical protein
MHFANMLNYTCVFTIASFYFVSIICFVLLHPTLKTQNSKKKKKKKKKKAHMPVRGCVSRPCLSAMLIIETPGAMLSNGCIVLCIVLAVAPREPAGCVSHVCCGSLRAAASASREKNGQARSFIILLYHRTLELLSLSHLKFALHISTTLAFYVHYAALSVPLPQILAITVDN